jgi:hypothetical protein
LRTSAEIRATLSPVFFIVNWGVAQNGLVDPEYDHKIEAWLDKARRVMFLPRFVVSLFPAWDNCSKAGW